MSIEIIVPRLGWSMEEGAFVAWLKQDGEFVRAGDLLFSIEGDKAVQEIESIDSGVLRIVPGGPKPGQPIRVGDLLGHLVPSNQKVPPAPPKPMPVVPVAAPEAVVKPTSVPPPSRGPVMAPSRVNPAISPRAFRVANELGVDWAGLQGTGRNGRIRERDVREAARLRTVSTGPESPVRGEITRSGSVPQAVFFGELLMRLETRQHARFTQATGFEVRYTGAEANAAVSVAQFGVPSCVVSAVPDHELGQACINFLRQFGVDTAHIARRGSRLGTFYLEMGAPPRPSKVIYDRAGSSFAELGTGQLDWEAILPGKQWFHWSGTAPALSARMPAVVAEACAAAKNHGLLVSCDLNYRSKLWSAQAAREVMTPLMRHVDLLIGNEEQIGLVLGLQPTPATEGVAPLDRCARLGQSLREHFHFREVALTLRENSDSGPSGWCSLLVNEQGTFASRPYPVASVDRIGAGDAFSGALIYARLAGFDPQQTIEFAAAAGALKHSIPGDFNLVSRDEVLALVRGEDGRRVLR